MDPDEGYCRRIVNGSPIKVSASGGNDTAHEQPNDNGRRFHYWCSEALANNDGDEDGKPKANELSTAPWKCVWRIDGRAQPKDTCLRSL